MGRRPAARCPRVASSAPWVPVRIPVATGFFSCRPDPVVRLHPQGTRGGLPHLPGPLLPRKLGRPAPFSNPCLFMDMGTFYPSRKREVAPSRVCLSVRPGCALSKHVDSPLTPLSPLGLTLQLWLALCQRVSMGGRLESEGLGGSGRWEVRPGYWPPYQGSGCCTSWCSSYSPICVPFLVFLAGNFRVCKQEEKMKEDCPLSSHVAVSDSKSILK